LIQRGDLFGSSFAFTVARDGDEWTTDDSGKHLRYIRAIDGLYDVGPVLTPAYIDTSVAVRSLEKHLQTHRPALKLPALRRDAKTEKAIRRFLEAAWPQSRVTFASIAAQPGWACTHR
jgi:phage head maturation protease